MRWKVKSVGSVCCIFTQRFVKPVNCCVYLFILVLKSIIIGFTGYASYMVCNGSTESSECSGYMCFYCFYRFKKLQNLVNI